MPNTGITDIPSKHSVAESIDAIEAAVRGRGFLVFARIDFSGDAARAGLTMRPMQALIFGQPKGGTPLLVASPRAGLDLPLKALAWEDESGKVWVSMNTPAYLTERHGLSDALVANVAGAPGLVAKALG